MNKFILIDICDELFNANIIIKKEKRELVKYNTRISKYRLIISNKLYYSWIGYTKLNYNE